MDTEQSIFEIISSAGSARDLTYQAIDQISNGNIESAYDLIEDAEKAMNTAHNV